MPRSFGALQKAILVFILPTFTLATSVDQTQAQDVNYRREIIEYVLHPCWRVAIRKHGLDKTMGEEQALNIMGVMQEKETQSIINALMPLISGKDRSARKLIYDISLETCIGGVGHRHYLSSNRSPLLQFQGSINFPCHMPSPSALAWSS